MKIDSVSYAVASKVVKTFSMSVSRIRGFSTSNGWLHVFDLKAVPATGTGVIPKRSYPIYATAAFDVMLADEPLDFINGCVCALSTTQGAYVELASTMDLFVTGTSHIDDTGWTTAGDYTTADEVLQVWADPSATPQRLVRLEASDVGVGSGGVFVQVHAGDTPTNATLFNSFPLENAGLIDLFFGDGLAVYRQNGATEYKGCTIALSTTPLTYTALASDIAWIKATYK